MFCTKCGTQNEADASFCGSCGKPLASGRIPVATAGAQPTPTAGTKSDAPPPETVLWEGTVSWKAFFFQIVGYALLLVVGNWFFIKAEIYVGSVVLTLVWAIDMFRLWLRLRMIRFKLTSQRFFVTDAKWFVSTTEELELFKLNDFKLRRSLFDWFFGIGKIGIITSDPSTPTLTILGVEKPHEVKELMRTTAMKLREGKIQFHAGL